MKSFRLILVAVFIVAFTMIACSDDEDTPTDPASGPPDGSSPSNVCNEDFCAKNSALKQQCQEFLDNCLEAEPQNQDECVGGAWLICQG